MLPGTHVCFPELAPGWARAGPRAGHRVGPHGFGAGPRIFGVRPLQIWGWAPTDLMLSSADLGLGPADLGLGPLVLGFGLYSWGSVPWFWGWVPWFWACTSWLGALKPVLLSLIKEYATESKKWGFSALSETKKKDVHLTINLS